MRITIIVLGISLCIFGCMSHHQMRGNQYLANGQWDEAIAEYNNAIEANPQDYEAYTFRGFCWRKKEKYDKAIADYTKSIEIQPTSEAYSARGLVWDEKKDYEKSAEDYGHAIKLKEDYYNYLGRCTAYKNLGKKKEALADAKKCKELAESDLEKLAAEKLIKSLNK